MPRIGSIIPRGNVLSRPRARLGTRFAKLGIAGQGRRQGRAPLFGGRQGWAGASGRPTKSIFERGRPCGPRPWPGPSRVAGHVQGPFLPAWPPLDLDVRARGRWRLVLMWGCFFFFGLVGVVVWFNGFVWGDYFFCGCVVRWWFEFFLCLKIVVFENVDIFYVWVVWAVLFFIAMCDFNMSWKLQNILCYLNIDIWNGIFYTMNVLKFIALSSFLYSFFILQFKKFLEIFPKFIVTIAVLFFFSYPIIFLSCLQLYTFRLHILQSIFESFISFTN